MKKVVRFILILICALILILCGLIIYVAAYNNPADKELDEAGIVEKQVQVGSVTFNYAEGPDNGPALVLLHAQLLDWYTYSAVLPELSKGFHVYAIDYPGHGKTIVPEGYVMSAENIGNDLGRFIDEVIGTEVYVTSNSSGGLLATYLAANRGDVVKAIVLEDPPLFSSEYPAVKTTVANKAFTQSHNALESEDYDGTWNKDFNHEEALKKIDCPVLLIQANTGYLTDGTLDGAMSKEMAEVAMDCLSDGKDLYVDSGHVTNLEVPDQFIAIVEDFFLEA